jgi:hypothetical protein
MTWGGSQWGASVTGPSVDGWAHKHRKKGSAAHLHIRHPHPSRVECPPIRGGSQHGAAVRRGVVVATGQGRPGPGDAVGGAGHADGAQHPVAGPLQPGARPGSAVVEEEPALLVVACEDKCLGQPSGLSTLSTPRPRGLVTACAPTKHRTAGAPTELASKLLGAPRPKTRPAEDADALRRWALPAWRVAKQTAPWVSAQQAGATLGRGDAHVAAPPAATRLFQQAVTSWPVRW